MGDIVERLSQLERRYASSTYPKLQNLFCESYICVFQLLSGIHREISKTKLQSAFSSTSSGCKEKLDEIIYNLRQKEESVRLQIEILDGDHHRNSRRENIENIIIAWLRREKVTNACHARLQQLLQDQHSGTFLWTKEHPQIAPWIDRLSDPKQRVIIVYAPPGCGKSTLCAHIINDIRNVDESTPCSVLYHFYGFDQTFTAAQILCHFASQLFHCLLSSCLRSPTGIPVVEKIKKIVENETQSPLLRAQAIIKDLTEHSVPSPVWIFLDGLDEEVNLKQPKLWDEVKTVLKFLFDLSRTISNVRFWISSQNLGRVQDVLKDYKPINIDTQMRIDVAKFITTVATKLDLGELESQGLIEIMCERAESGGFLWAKLLIKELEYAISPAEKVRAIIEGGPSLEDIYRRFFDRILPSNQSARTRVHNLFALVAFARRPLRIGELQEAATILEQNGSQDDVQNLPHELMATSGISGIKAICAPLIVFRAEGEKTDERMETCHLYHSSFLKFLLKNADALDHQITHLIIADACTKYLQQPRYSQYLEKSIVHGKEEWRDFSRESIADHWFLSYAAKYWDKHRDLHGFMVSFEGYECTPDQREEVVLSALASSTQQHLKTVKLFLDSDNFRTCLQVQSLLVDGQFLLAAMPMSRPGLQPYLCLKRVLPNWLDDAHRTQYWKGYEMFCAEWITLLCQRGLDLGSHQLLFCRGEMDRCWWGALHPDNFLHRQTDTSASRYASFRLGGENCPNTPKTYVCSTVCATGTQIGELEFFVNGDFGHIYLNWWSLDVLGKFKLVASSKERLIAKRRLNLEQYMLCGKRLTTRDDRASLAQFDDSGNCFRLGTQVFLRHPEAHTSFHTVNIPCLRYVEEIASRGPIIAIARRRKPLMRCNLQHSEEEASDNDDDYDEDALKAYKLFGFKEQIWRTDDSESAHISSLPSVDDADTSSEYSTNADSDEESSGDAWESWSECSSHISRDGFEEDESDERQRRRKHLQVFQDKERDSESNENYDEAEGSDDNDSGDNQEQVSEDDERNTVNRSPRHIRHLSPLMGCSDPDQSDSDIHGASRRELGGCQIRPYGQENLSSDEEDAYRDNDSGRMPRKKAKRRSTPSFHARLCVFDATSPEMPKEIFSFADGLLLPLHNSPPTIHPTYSLIVWPLSGGRLLFGDFETGSYFKRKLKASTASSEFFFFKVNQAWMAYKRILARHIFMKCHFSGCGRYLHIAALESQTDRSDDNERTPELETQLFAMVTYTFRLCSSGATRKSPTFVHQARVDLGQYSQASVDNPPFTLTWGERMLYVTERFLTLKVHRISLFRETSADEDIYPVFRPEKTIVMPGTSMRRNAYFFPTVEEGNVESRVILSAHSEYPKDYPVIGCFLKKEDLGEWVRSAGTQDVPNPLGDGNLLLSREMFDPEEDCD
ncbi:hypothetical protein H0H87_005358, partial [Tephrocybe sp. NHM501043]